MGKKFISSESGIPDLFVEYVRSSAAYKDKIVFQPRQLVQDNSLSPARYNIVQRFTIEVNPEDTQFPEIASYSNHSAMIDLPMDIGMLSTYEVPSSPYFKMSSTWNYMSDAWFERASQIDERGLVSVYLNQPSVYNSSVMDLSTTTAPVDRNKIESGNYMFTLDMFGTRSQRMQNIMFGTNFDFGSQNAGKSEFPAYSKINFSSNANDYYILNGLVDNAALESYMLSYDSYNTEDIDFDFYDGFGFRSTPCVDLFDSVDSFPFSLNYGTIISLSDSPSLTGIEKISKKYLLNQTLKQRTKKARTYEEIVRNIPAHTEIVFYKVEKYPRNSPGQGIPLQQFWVPGNHTNIEIIDTQIRNNTSYTYKVKAYFLICGSEYEYSLINSTSTNDKRILEYEVIVKPSYKIIEYELFSGANVVTQPPPLVPIISFNNETNSRNKINIFAQLKGGMERSQYDAPIVDNNNAVGQTDEDGLTTFLNSNEKGKFIIYRKTSKPTAEDAFNDTYDTFEGLNQERFAYYKDVIIPNKKYYYTFRAYNKSGVIGNPTPIYEVELVRDADSSKVVVKTYKMPELAEEAASDPSLDFKNLLSVSPALHQRSLIESDDFDGTTYLGTMNKTSLGSPGSSPVWGRKFKIRIKSNDSGKMMDFNVLFDLSKEEN
jgi:hypothetical protein